MNIIHIIMTGGTIDSVWDAKMDMVVVADKSIIPDYFADKKIASELTFTQVCMKDSRAFAQEDLQNILKTVEESKSTKILITHGTYTMPDTAVFLKTHLIRKDQVIILTGAVTPIQGFERSDGPFNLDFAISNFDKLQPGIYLCMNGEIFTLEEVTKNFAEGRFYSVFENKQ